MSTVEGWLFQPFIPNLLPFVFSSLFPIDQGITLRLLSHRIYFKKDIRVIDSIDFFRIACG
jgi:hypothetical protein